MLRVIGGFCVILTLSKIINYFPFELQIVINIMMIFQLFQISIILIIKIIYVFYLLKNKPELFEIRNSPLNSGATMVSKFALCFYFGVFVPVITTGVVTGVTIGIDDILDRSDRDPVFKPLYKDLFDGIYKRTGFFPPRGVNINTSVGLNDLQNSLKESEATFTPSEKASVTTVVQEYSSLSDQAKKAFIDSLIEDINQKRK